MAEQPSKRYNIKQPEFKPSQRTKTQRAFFFVDGKLYKKLSQNGASDVLTAQDQDTNRVVQFVLSDVKRRMKPAYDTSEVAKMLNRGHQTILSYLSKGYINPPKQVYSWGMNLHGQPFHKKKWSEDDILALHTFLLSNSAGRPRKNGTLYSATRIPSRRELLAVLRQQPMFYMQTADGEFVPVWSAYDGV